MDNCEWSIESLKNEQEIDQNICLIVQLIKKDRIKPSWQTVALAFHDVKVLWAQWPCLQIRDGLLKWRFESLDSLHIYWQIVWPARLRKEFLQLVHGGVTAGHLSRRCTAAAILLAVLVK